MYFNLWRAVIDGNVQEVADLLKSIADINARYNYGKTILMIASKEDNLEVVKLLLASPGIEVNAKDRDGHTALSVAVERGHTEIVKLLLASPGIDVNAKGRNVIPALARAARGGHTEIVKLLLASPGIDVNAKGRNGIPALASAASEGYTEIVKLLLASPGIDVNAGAALARAARGGHTEIVKLLLASPDIEVNAEDIDGKTALSVAAERGYIDIVRLLLRRSNALISSYDIFYTANTKVQKYLLFSGVLDKELVSSFPDPYRSNSGYNFVGGMKDMLNTLTHVVKGEALEAFPHRVNLLVASILNKTFPEDITVKHTGMSIPKFRSVSRLMRAAKLGELLCGYNSYMFIHMLMLRSYAGDFLSKLDLGQRAEVSSFLTGEDFVSDMAGFSALMKKRDEKEELSANAEHSLGPKI